MDFKLSKFVLIVILSGVQAADVQRRQERSPDWRGDQHWLPYPFHPKLGRILPDPQPQGLCYEVIPNTRVVQGLPI